MMTVKQSLICCAVIFTSVLWNFYSMRAEPEEDQMLQKGLSQMNVDTPYLLTYEDGTTENGELGQFYNCFIEFKGLLKAKAKEGKLRYGKLTVSKNTYVELSIVDNEAYRFYLLYAEEGIEAYEKKAFRGSRRSDSYAINCNLSLLNKFD